MMRMLAAFLCIVSASTTFAQPQSAAAGQKHEIIQCMSKRMAADRLVSYNDAMRACKERLQDSKDALASNNTAVSPAKLP